MFIGQAIIVEDDRGWLADDEVFQALAHVAAASAVARWTIIERRFDIVGALDVLISGV